MDIQTLAAAIAVAKKINSTPEYVTAAVEAWLSEHVDPSTGYVLDDTLTVEGAAADAKAAGDEIADLKSALRSTVFTIGTTEPPIAWEQGTVNSSGGGNQDNAKRIRTNAFKKGYIYSVEPKTGFRLELAAYDATNNNAYVGLWDGSSFVKTVQLDTKEIILTDLPETYLYKLVLDYPDNIDPSAYTNCIVKYKNCVERNEFYPEKWNFAFDSANAMNDGLLPRLTCEKGTIGSSGQKVSSGTVVRTTTAITFPKDTFIRCNDPEYYFAIRSYRASEISADNFIEYNGTQYGTYRLAANQYYVITISRRDAASVDSVDSYSQKIDVWSNLYLENQNQHCLKYFAPFGNAKRKIIGHKGITSDAPENTLPSFEAAGVGGVWGIETDIQCTADGYLICLHDTTLDRTTTGTGNVSEKTFAEIEALSIKNYPDLKVPTLEQFLGICKMYDCVPVIEIKSTAISQNALTKLINTLIEYGLDSRSIILCASTSIGYIQCINEKIPCIMQIDPTDLEQQLFDAKRFFNTNATISSSYTVTRDIISTVHQAGMAVGIGGVNSVDDMKEYFAMGADYVSSDFITTY